MKILDFMKKNKKSKEQLPEKYGLVSNFITRQMFMEKGTAIEIQYDGFQEAIETQNIRTLIIDNDLYEADHIWFGKSLDRLISYAEKKKIEVIVIKNTEKPVRPSLEMYFRLELDPHANTITHTNDGLKLPLLLDPHTFNPINSYEEIDVLYISPGNLMQEKAIDKFHNKFSPSFEEVVLEEVTRESIVAIVEQVRSAKTMYIGRFEKIDRILLKYFEVIGYLLNTYVIFDPEYNYEPEYGVKSESAQANVSKIRAVINNGLYKDKKVLPIQRRAFLDNTFLLHPSIEKLLMGKVDKEVVEVSAIISTNRPSNVEFVIDQMNDQKDIKLQVVLVTHGFKLSDAEQKVIQGRIEFELIILHESETVSLGNCLNKAIAEVRHPVVTKIDDDDYYTGNYLIDQWIALKYSGADLVGKAAHYVYMEEEDVVIKREKDKYFKFDRFIMGATIMAQTDYMKQYMFNDLPSAVDTDLLNRVRASEGKIYQGHPYELCVYRGADKGKHTWKVEDRAMLSSAEVVCYGDPRPTIKMD